MTSNRLNRRAFISGTSKTALGVATAPLLCNERLFGGEMTDRKLNIACIGLGGQMHNVLLPNLTALQDKMNIIAICDLEPNRIADTRKNFPQVLAGAKEYQDYRKLLESEKSLDAVVIASPDHWHAALCKAAMQACKHVYCEKPLTHTVEEARQVAEMAKQSKVVTQTGNQGSGSSNFRRSIEVIQAGVLGEVSEVHIWHPPHGWPNGVARPPGTDPVPDGFDWDFWTGPAPMRPFKQGIYHPGAWRGWFDFGGGSLADFCCHAFSMPVRALNLDYPDRIEISGSPLGGDSFPHSARIRFSFPGRGDRGPVSIFFHTGGDQPCSMLPPDEVTSGMKETFGEIPSTGCLVLGDKGKISAGLWNNDFYIKMKDEVKFKGLKHEAVISVPETLPRAPQNNHMLEWVEACRGKGQTFSPFEIGGHITEIGAAGLIALRLGRDIEWDGLAMTAKGQPETAAWVRAQHRNQWGV